MNEIRLRVTANKLETENDVLTTSGSANFDECVFTFDSINNRCRIPVVCLKRDGMLRINVIGMDYNDVIITTNSIGHKVEEGVNDVSSALQDD